MDDIIQVECFVHRRQRDLAVGWERRWAWNQGHRSYSLVTTTYPTTQRTTGKLQTTFDQIYRRGKAHVKTSLEACASSIQNIMVPP